MKVVILCGGKAPSKELFYSEMENSDYLICADKGANYAFNYGKNPDILLGDFDSVNNEILDYYKALNITIEKFPVEKDYTDSEIAFEKASQLGATEIIFLGCTGSRLDHTFGNIGLLRRAVDLGIEAFMKDDYNVIFMLNSSRVLKSSKGTMFSLQAYNNDVTGLTIVGAKYPLDNYCLEVGSSITISNEFLDETVKVDFNRGLVIVFFSKDKL